MAEPTSTEPGPEDEAAEPLPESVRPAYDKLVSGDNVAALEALRPALESASSEDARAAAQRIQRAVRPDRKVLLCALGLLGSLLLLALVIVMPPATVSQARSLVDAVERGDEAAGQVFFVGDAWERGGKGWFQAFRGRRGRVFALSARARELGFVMVEFLTDGRPDFGTRRYLLFKDTAEGQRVRRIVRRRPMPKDGA